LPAAETEATTVNPVNSYGSIYFEYGDGFPSSDDRRSNGSPREVYVANDGTVREAVVGAKFKSGLTQPQRFFDPDNQPARPTHRRIKQEHRGAGRPPAPDPELISRSEYNQQVYFLQTQIHILQQSIDDVRHHLKKVAQVVGNLKSSQAA